MTAPHKRGAQEFPVLRHGHLNRDLHVYTVKTSVERALQSLCKEHSSFLCCLADLTEAAVRLTFKRHKTGAHTVNSTTMHLVTQSHIPAPSSLCRDTSKTGESHL